MDQGKCTVVLSTGAQSWLQPYAFTPELVELAPHDRKTFSYKFLRSKIGASACKALSVAISLSYLSAEDASGLRLDGSQDAHAYVLKRQSVIMSAELEIEP